jgi:hypothetical protein
MYTILRHTPAHKCRDFDDDRSPINETLGQRVLGTPPVSYTQYFLYTHMLIRCLVVGQLLREDHLFYQAPISASAETY